MTPPDCEFSLVFSRTHGTVVVYVVGALDAASARQLDDRLVDIIDGQGNLRLVVDLADTRSIDRAGLAVLVDALQRMRRTSGELLLSGPTGEVAQALNAAGLDKVFVITPAWAHPAYGDSGSRAGHPAGWGRSG